MRISDWSSDVCSSDLPIRLGWFAIVLPALALNYLGQGALALTSLDQAMTAGVPFTNDNWFFLLAPPAARIPLVLLALVTTVIASQMAIDGAYSLTQQARDRKSTRLNSSH